MNRLLIATGIRMVGFISSTWRVKIHGEVPAGNFIAAFWHGSMLPGWYAFRKRKPLAMVSLSKDGQILSDLLHRWGIETLRGSSGKGGSEVLESAVSSGRDRVVLITPDGPKGPAMKMKAGAFKIAQKTGNRLIIVRIDICGKFIFKKSWDSFLLPLPFAKIKITVADSFFIAPEATREEIDSLMKQSERLLS